MKPILILLLLSGCQVPLGAQTAGDLSRVTFSYTDGYGCAFGCRVNQPLLTGATETLLAQDGADVLAAEASLDPVGVVTATAGSLSSKDGASAWRSFALQTLGAGDATFALSVGGRELDRTTIHVRDAARIVPQWAVSTELPNSTFKEGPLLTGAQLHSSVGQTLDFKLEAFDQSEEALQLGVGGIHVTIDDGTVMGIESLSGADVTDSATIPQLGVTSFVLRAHAAGTTTIRLDAKSVTLQLPVIVD